MPEPTGLILGEAIRSLDDRYRLSLPALFADPLTAQSPHCILAKEQPGCLSLWDQASWQTKLDEGVALVERKIEAGRLEGRLEEVQLLGRLLSTRHAEVRLAGRGRLVLGEGFREFLGVEPGEDVVVVGAAICVELWHPPPWQAHVGEAMPGFRQLLNQLSS